MRRFAGVVALLALIAVTSPLFPNLGLDVSQAKPAVASTDACEQGLVAFAESAARPCIIRCSDLTGCQRCCPSKGGWVCTPI